MGGSAYNDPHREGYGGGLHNAAVLTLRRCEFVGNRATDGGGVANDGVLTLKRCILENNTADHGGGMYNAGQLMCRKSLVAGNSSFGFGNWPRALPGYGGGMFNTGTCTVDRSTFESNLVQGGGYYYAGADGYGGGMYNEGRLLITDSTLNGNCALGKRESYGAGDSYGGGLFNCTGGVVAAANTTISGNSAIGGHVGHYFGRAGDGLGGGIYNQGQADLNHCTICANLAEPGNRYEANGNGGGIYAQNLVDAANTIIADNFAGDAGPDCWGTLDSDGYNLIEDTDSCVVQGDMTGIVLGTDPLLGPLSDNGGPTWTHALLKGSLAIDQGSHGGLPKDQRGAKRPTDIKQVPNQADGSDIGAYELSRQDWRRSRD
jgi:hypothetical protein